MKSSEYRHNLRIKGLTTNLSELVANNIFSKRDVKASRRGYPDFSILNKDDEIIAFVEVKRTKVKKLKKEQERFKRFCEAKNVPFLQWCPDDGEKALIEFLDSLFSNLT